MAYWLFKSEPETFGIDTLAHRPKKTEHWDGVRNYQARNMLRDQIKVGDQAFFYHSNCTPPGIVGIIDIVKAGYPDFTAFDPESKYYDPTSTPDNPRWFMVDVHFIKKFKHMFTLEELKQHSALRNMQVARKGNRLSITPVTEHEWKVILEITK
jgi:predicted RNA-binding protein with PUA-like domain